MTLGRDTLLAEEVTTVVIYCLEDLVVISFMSHVAGLDDAFIFRLF